MALSLSMGLHWFKLEDARAVVAKAIAQKLVEETEGGFKPSFDLSSVDIPLDYSPSEDILAEDQVEDVFMSVVDRIVNATKLEKTTVISNVNKMKSRMGVTIEVAALMVARSYDVDVSRYYENVQNNLIENA